VAQQIAILQVYPDAGLRLEGWAREEDQLIAFPNVGKSGRTLAEHGAMNRAAERGGSIRWQWRWCRADHIG
jgi:hypothetical protein